jgi:hypothetical protein
MKISGQMIAIYQGQKPGNQPPSLPSNDQNALKASDLNTGKSETFGGEVIKKIALVIQNLIDAVSNLIPSIFKQGGSKFEEIKSEASQITYEKNTFYPVHINQDWIPRVPGDGSCLFHSVGLVLQTFPLKDKEGHMIDVDSHTLRKMVCDWEREYIKSDEFLQGMVDDSIEHYIKKIRQEKKDMENTLKLLSTQFPNRDTSRIVRDIENHEALILKYEQSSPIERRELYIKLLENKAFFASCSEIYALSALFDKEIYIRIVGKNGRWNHVDKISHPTCTSNDVITLQLSNNHFSPVFTKE